MGGGAGMMLSLNVLREKYRSACCCRGPDQTEAQYGGPHAGWGPGRITSPPRAEEGPFLCCVPGVFWQKLLGKEPGVYGSATSAQGSAEASFTRDLRELGPWGGGSLGE